MKYFDKLLRAAVELAIWISDRVWQLATWLVTLPDVWQAWQRSEHAAKHGIRCANGHRLVEHATWQCACGFRWTGDPWWCRNPFCAKPATDFVDCQVCHTSVPNPHRGSGGHR